MYEVLRKFQESHPLKGCTAGPQFIISTEIMDKITNQVTIIFTLFLGSGGRHFFCFWRCRMLSVPLGEQASGRICFGAQWYTDVPGGRGTRDGDDDKITVLLISQLDKFDILISWRTLINQKINQNLFIVHNIKETKIPSKCK